ncbi:MAG: glutamate-5-semialdehyde dehydrogenase [Thermoanaerobaculia bacterium]|nr:glutamate-5-semialdehyde dehydrogenase [Thermoanaerobaculia bacterium]
MTPQTDSPASSAIQASPKEGQSQSLAELVSAARTAQRRLAAAGREARRKALVNLAEAIRRDEGSILLANRKDLKAAADEGLEGPLLHRLALGGSKLETLAEGVEQLVAKADPVGRRLRHTELDEGLVLQQVTSPIGVLLVIFESRPDAVIQIGSLAIQTGNAVILKGGREAAESNRILVGILRQALEDAGLDPAAVALVEGRAAVAELLSFDDQIDLVIPRGSGELVRTIQGSTRIPVLGHAEGICHLYLHADADPQMATRLVLDGKCGYPAACNATETLLVHVQFLPHLVQVAAALVAAGVKLRVDDAAAEALTGVEGVQPAVDEDWATEWGDLVLGIRTVQSLDEAVDHIHRHGSAHTEAIVTGDPAVGECFTQIVDAASVFVNASTRFADGYRYGLGAEVGISTGRIHARGPVGAEGLLTTRWLLNGSGQVAGDYGPSGRSFTHRSLPIENT